MKPPSRITNLAHWEKNCLTIRARASDLIEGRLSVVEAARSLAKLTYWTGLADDVDLRTFVAIDSDTDHLPVGDVRALWAEHALVLHDVAIADAEAFYKGPAVEAAHRLVERFAWSVEARSARRNNGQASVDSLDRKGGSKIAKLASDAQSTSRALMQSTKSA